eukprot:scaffold101846_cov60-Phaeocystis_antarctica.AAC.1
MQPIYHSICKRLQSLSPRRLPQERSRRGRPRAPGSNDAERGPALLVQLAQLQLLAPQGAPGWSTAKKWAAVEAASSSTRGSGWVSSGPAGSPVRRRRSRSGALPRAQGRTWTTLARRSRMPGWSDAVKSAALEAACSSRRGSGWALSGPASSWECRAAQSRQARPEETLTLLGCSLVASRSRQPAQQRRRPSRPG